MPSPFGLSELDDLRNNECSAFASDNPSLSKALASSVRCR